MSDYVKQIRDTTRDVPYVVGFWFAVEVSVDEVIDRYKGLWSRHGSMKVTASPLLLCHYVTFPLSEESHRPLQVPSAGNVINLRKGFKKNH